MTIRTIYGSEVEVLDGDLQAGTVSVKRLSDGKIYYGMPICNLIAPMGANEIRGAIMRARDKRAR